ncbi:MAG: TolC family protein [Bryobacterales bacterium]|nr:TolC family protein [Bryobacterales bacterium]
MTKALCVLVAFGLGVAAQDRATVSGSIAERTGLQVRPEAAASEFKTGSFPPGLKFTGRISREDAVAIALWNSSALQATLKDLGLAQADLMDAGLLRNPSFQALLPIAGKPFEFVLQWPVEILWQRPRRLAAARANLSQVGQTLIQAGLDVVRDARLAHAELALAERRSEAASQAQRLRRRIAELTQKRLDVGDVSAFEANQARVDLNLMQETAQRLARDADAARERLRMTIGLRGTTERLVAAEASVDAQAPSEMDALLKTAMESRPDLRAAELAVETAMRNARWERSKVYAAVTPLLSIKETGTPTKTRTGPGLQAELPILNRNQGRIKRADVEVERAALLYLAARDRVEAEVREARVQLVQALESLEYLRSQVRPPVEEAIRLAEKAYAQGDVAFLSVLEAGRQVYDLELREADAAASFQRARARLEHGIGRRL